MNIAEAIETQLKSKEFPTDDREPWPQDTAALYQILSGSELFRGRAFANGMMLMLDLMLMNPGPSATKEQRDAHAKKAENLATRLAAAIFISGYKVGKAEAEV